MTRNRVMLRPQPSAYSRAGNACGYNCCCSGKQGILSANAHFMSTMFGWCGNAFRNLSASLDVMKEQDEWNWGKTLQHPIRQAICFKGSNDFSDGNQEKVASSWLSSISLKEQDLLLKQCEFVDAIRTRYGWPIYNLPSKCACGEPFDTQHAISCNKEGFVTLWNNQLRDFYWMRFEKMLKANHFPSHPRSGETNTHKSTSTADEARHELSARGFWIAGQRSFFDIRVYKYNSNTWSYQRNLITMSMCCRPKWLVHSTSFRTQVAWHLITDCSTSDPHTPLRKEELWLFHN